MTGALRNTGSRRPLAVALLAAGILLIGFGFLTLLSIGILILPIGVAMIVAATWARPWAGVGITLAAVTFSATYALTAPLGCLQTSRLDGASAGITSCSRLGLPDLHRQPEAGDYVLAMSAAAVAAAVVGTASAALVRLGMRRHRAT